MRKGKSKQQEDKVRQPQPSCAKTRTRIAGQHEAGAARHCGQFFAKSEHQQQTGKEMRQNGRLLARLRRYGETGLATSPPRIHRPRLAVSTPRPRLEPYTPRCLDASTPTPGLHASTPRRLDASTPRRLDTSAPPHLEASTLGLDASDSTPPRLQDSMLGGLDASTPRSVEASRRSCWTAVGVFCARAFGPTPKPKDKSAELA